MVSDVSSPHLRAITCSKCGAALDPSSGEQILVCTYCQTSHVFTPPPAVAPIAASRKFPLGPLLIAAAALVALSGAALALLGSAPASAPQSPPAVEREVKPLPTPAEQATAGDPLATYDVGQTVDVYWGSRWWPGRVLNRDGSRYRITYDGWSSSWDEWVGPDRLRKRESRR
jgi:hypothetical protein